MANVMVRRPEGKVRPYAGAGAGWVWAKMGVGAFFPNTYSLPAGSVTEGAFGWQVLVGVDNPVNEKLSWFLEYKFTASEIDLGAEYGLDLEYMASQLYAGLSYQF
jgi:opacity protein-like surface antigen